MSQNKSNESPLHELEQLRREYAELKAAYEKNINIQKQTEEKQKNSEARYKAIFESTGTATLIVDEDTTILLANDECYEMFGYEPTQLFEQKWTRFVAPESVQEMIGNHNLRRENPELAPKKYEVKLLNSKGKKRDTVLNINMIPGTKQSVVSMLDITERKQAEGELRKSKSNLEEYFENDISADYVVSVSGEIFSCNKTFLRLFGFEKKSETEKFDITGLHKNPKDRKNILRLIKKQGKVENHEVEFVSKTGNSIYALVNAIGIFDKDDKLEKIRGYIVDITQQKNVEKELVKFKLCIERSSEAIFITDVEGHIIFVNPAFEQLYGYTSDECIGKTPRILKSGTYDEEVYKNFWSTLLSKNTVSGEIVNKTKKGSLITMDVYNTSILDSNGKIYGFIGIHRDITERKKIEEELKKSEEKYRLLFANNPQPMWIYDLETLAFLEVNQAAINHYGFSKEEFLSMTLKDIRPAEDIPALLEDIKYTHLDYNTTGDWRHRKKNGEIIDVEISSHSMLFNDRNARHILIKDVTERKKAEQEIIYQSQMQKILRKIASDFINLPLTKVDEVIKESLGEIGKFVNTDRVYVFDYDWNNNVCNNTYEWCSLTVKPQIAELQGVPLDAVPHWVNTHKQGKIMHIPDVFALPENDAVRQILEPQEIKSLITIPIMDGQECIGFLGFDSVRRHHNYTEAEEGVLAVLAQMFVNISHRKHADEERQKLLHAIEQSPVSIIVTDLNGNIEYVNPKTLEITGYTKEELIGKNSRIFNSGKKPKKEYQQLWSTILSGKEWFGEFHNKKKNGELYWESASISPILNRKLKIINYVAIKEDITERKKFIEDLKVAKEKAEESDRLKSAFLANMSHEIRTPMNGILGFTDLLLDPGLSSEEKESYIKIVHKSGQRMLNTVNDIIEISKIEAGLVELRYEFTDFNKKVEELIQFFTPEANGKGLKIILKKLLPEEKKYFFTDQNKLYSILTNLIKNAIKYTKAGTITIGCQFKEPVIEFHISDTGIGIPKHRQEAIFNRFEQADIEDTRVFEGSGLGLAIAKSYVEMLGGNIWVESEEANLSAGKTGGSTFYFTLPATSKTDEKPIHADKISSDNNNAKSKTKELKIIIAEDDEASRTYLSLLMNDFSKEILFAETGSKSVELCRDNTDINLILIDIQMPGMNGYEATRQIREFNRDVIIIAQTAFALSGDKSKAIAAGCNDYISKPINRNNLQALIQKYFG